IEYKGTKPAMGLDLAKKSSKELVDLLTHPNSWFRGEARRILAERRDKEVIPLLRTMVVDKKDRLALESVLAPYGGGGFDEEVAGKLLSHANEDVRTCTVRFLGDAKKVSAGLRQQLVALARSDTSPTVRSQLACSSKRLPAQDCLPIVRELLQRSEDVDDLHNPMLLWWAVDDKAISHRDLVLDLLNTPEMWNKPLVQKYLVERLARRYMAEASEASYAACARLLAAAPGKEEMNLLVRGMDKALEG